MLCPHRIVFKPFAILLLNTWILCLSGLNDGLNLPCRIDVVYFNSAAPPCWVTFTRNNHQIIDDLWNLTFFQFNRTINLHGISKLIINWIHRSRIIGIVIPESTSNYHPIFFRLGQFLWLIVTPFPHLSNQFNEKKNFETIFQSTWKLWFVIRKPMEILSIKFIDPKTKKLNDQSGTFYQEKHGIKKTFL